MSELTSILLDLIPSDDTSTTLEIATLPPLHPGSIVCDEKTIATALQGDPLPYEAATFDSLICRGLLHRATRIDTLIAEYARVLKPGGQIGLIEPVTPGEPAVARFMNDLARAQCASHQWAGSVDDLVTALSLAGLEKTYAEIISERMAFNSWLEGSDLPPDDLSRVRAALLAAPQKPAEWLEIEQAGHRITFMCLTAVIIGRKSIADS